MLDPKEYRDKARKHFEEMSPQVHADIYTQYYLAYLTNEEKGYPEQAEFCRRQMQGLLSFGKISEADRLVIEARTAQVRAQVKRELGEFLTEIRKTPNTTRH